MLVALDCETTGVLWQDTAFCVTTWDKEHCGVFWDLAIEADRLGLIAHLKRATTIVCHNLKFDLQKMILAGILGEDDVQYPGRFDDTMLMSQLLDENRSSRLKDLAKDFLGEETDEAKVLAECRRKLGLKVEDGYDKIPLDILRPYALKDAEYTFNLYKLLEPQLGAKKDPLYNLYRREIRFIFTLMKVEAAGMQVNLDTVAAKNKRYGSLIYEAKKEIADITGLKVFSEDDLIPRKLNLAIYTSAGKVRRTHETKKQATERAKATTFNPNSPTQVQEVFSQAGIQLTSTGHDELKDLQHPLASAILQLREYVKIKQTYLQGIMKEQHNGILHPNYRMRTRTGRLSSAAGE